MDDPIVIIILLLKLGYSNCEIWYIFFVWLFYSKWFLLLWCNVDTKIILDIYKYLYDRFNYYICYYGVVHSMKL